MQWLHRARRAASTPSLRPKSHHLERTKRIFGIWEVWRSFTDDHTKKHSKGYTEIKLPPLDDSIKTGTIVNWVSPEGETVQADADLCLIDTDIAEFLIDSPRAGILAKHLAKEGQQVPVGGAIALLVHEGVDFDEALAEYREENPEILSEEEKQEYQTLQDGMLDAREFTMARQGSMIHWGHDQVTSWLRNNEFSDSILKELSHYKGKDLVRLSKEDAEKYFGLEGIRLYGSIKEYVAENENVQL
ncbi:hypothetical protein AAMO2058_000640300 [Amorphochlora amoebiformis]